MTLGLSRLRRALFRSSRAGTLSEDRPTTRRRDIMRIAAFGLGIVTLLAGIGYGVVVRMTHGAPPPDAPLFDPKADVSSQERFDELARTNPVEMLNECLTKYHKNGVHTLHFTLEKHERVEGKPKHPTMPGVEIIDVWVRGDVPNPETKKTAIEVVMKWKQGAKKPLGIGAELKGSLFSELSKADGGLDGKVIAYRPGAWGGDIGTPTDPNIALAKAQSRYCIRDAGMYRSMLRTYEAWKARQAAGEFQFEYLGKKPIDKVGGRECHVVKRVCTRMEIDAFELGGTASTEPKVVAAEGFTEVTLFIDAERWLQLGSELYRTEPDGTRVLVGAYYFRDLEINPAVPADTFTAAGLKK
jgi:hypothetical protein